MNWKLKLFICTMGYQGGIRKSQLWVWSVQVFFPDLFVIDLWRAWIRLLIQFLLARECWILGSINKSKKLIHLCPVMVDCISTFLHRLFFLWLLNIKNVLHWVPVYCWRKKTGVLNYYMIPYEKPYEEVLMKKSLWLWSLIAIVRFA